MVKMDIQTTDARPPVGFYLMVLVLTMIGLSVLFGILETFVGVSAPTGISSVMPSLAAAMVTGDRYAKTHGALPSSLAAWRFAWLVTGLTLILTFIIIAGLAILDPSLQDIIADPSAAAVMLGFLVFITFVLLLINRFFLTQGAKARLR
jgi:hypothetical protein